MTVILDRQAGQLGNSLVLFAHFIANAIEYDYQLINTAFFPYAQYFDAFAQDALCRFPPGRTALGFDLRARKWINRIANRVPRLCQSLHVSASQVDLLDIDAEYDRLGRVCDLGDAEFITRRERTRYLFARGWLYRDAPNVNKHKERILQVFRPRDVFVQHIDELMARARLDCDVLVGVHIRHGDYREYRGGQYFYDLPTFAGLMRTMCALLPGKRVRFLICSNTTQDPAHFREFSYRMGTGHLVEDMYALARCDYLIGPPSTFTMWASFYGGTPLCMIHDPSVPFTLQQFRPHMI